MIRPSSSYVPHGGSIPNIGAGDFESTSSLGDDCYYCGIDSQACLYYCSDFSTIDSSWQWDWSYQYWRHSFCARKNLPSSVMSIRPDFFGKVFFPISPLFPTTNEDIDDCFDDSDLFKGLDLSRLPPKVYLQSLPALNSIRKEIWGVIITQADSSPEPAPLTIISLADKKYRHVPRYPTTMMVRKKEYRYHEIEIIAKRSVEFYQCSYCR